MRTANFILVALSVLSGLLLGCRAPTSAHDEAHLRWSERLRELGMAPVFPPREDMRVGDIFVYSVDPESPSAVQVSTKEARQLAASSRWSALAVNEELDTEYRARPPWPDTPDDFPNVAPSLENRGWPEQAAPAESIFKAEQTPTRLRAVALGPFSASSSSEGELNVLIPSEVVNVILGSAWTDSKAIIMRPHGAESYSLSLAKLIPMMVEETPGPTGRYTLKEEHRKHLSFVTDASSETVWIRVISEVLYIRSVDITVESKGSFREDDELHAYEVPESAIEPDTEENAAEGNEPPAAIQPAEEPGTDDHTIDSGFGAFVRAKAINQALFDSDADDFPGGFVRFLSVTDDSVSLRRIWRHGVAIGVRGLTLEVNKNTGAILRSGVLVDPIGKSSLLPFGGSN